MSSSVTFENPSPNTAAGLPLDQKDTFALASGWESGIHGRSIEKLAGQEDRYFKSAASNSSPRTKELLDNVALNDKRLIVDRSTTVVQVMMAMHGVLELKFLQQHLTNS